MTSSATSSAPARTRTALTGGARAAAGAAAALLLTAAPASAHSDLHGSVAGGSGSDPVPHVTLLALAVAGGLLLGPALTRREGSPVRRQRALQLLALVAAVGALLGELSPSRLAVTGLLLVSIALPLTSPVAKGAFLLVAPSLMLRPLDLDPHALVAVGHVLGAGLWAGTVVHLLTLPHLDRAAWRAGTRPAVAGILASSLSGVLSARQLGLTPANATDTAYGTALLVKVLVVAALVAGVAVLSRRTSRERVLRTEALVLLGVVATGVVLSVATPPLRDLVLPPGLAVEQGRSLLLTADGDRRVLRVSPAADVTVDGQPVATALGLDGALALELPREGRVELDGTPVDLPDVAVPLSPGPGDDGERLARTLGRVAAGTTEHPLADPVSALAGQREELDRRRLRAPVVVVDDDPRGPAVARALGARTVDVREGALPAGTDIVYVATSWSGARDALRTVSARQPIGGTVLLPWLLAPVTLDLAAAEAFVALSDVELEGPEAFAYRQVLARLPVEPPTAVGLRAYRPDGATDAVTYAATPAGIFPAEISHGHDARTLPAWTSGGSIVVTRRHDLSDSAS